jgi:hypothetical protein
MLLCSIVILVLLCVSGARATSPTTPTNSVAQALLWQARQYTHIKTIHFLAVGHDKFTKPNGKTETSTQRYEYWGAGIKYRIDFQQFVPQADSDFLVTDNGRHFRMFNRIAALMTIEPTHPIHHGVPVTPNPILMPLVPLAPFFPPRLGTPHMQWVNLARFTRNPQSIFDRCREVAPCGKKGLGVGLHGCILGAYQNYSVHVRFTIGGGMHHLLVTGWTANYLQLAGNYMRLSHIKYRAFRLPSRRKIFLPVAFDEKGMTKNMPGPGRGGWSNKVVISNVSIDQPIPPGEFNINYKLARFIKEVSPDGKAQFFSVYPTTSPAPPRERNSNK